MSAQESPNISRQIYRVDKFKVPDSARQEFVDRNQSIHEFLRTLPGFIQDTVLEQSGGPGEFNFVTIVIWESQEAIEAAKKVVMARYEATGFNPQDMFARLEIKADLANYQQVL